MPRIALQTVFVLSLAILFGCDGHSRLVYLRGSTTTAPPKYRFVRVIECHSEPDVLSAVQQVATELNLHPDPDVENGWTNRATGDTSSFFRLEVVREQENLWRVQMLDWPSFIRSDLSRAVEAKLVQLTN